jgi:hypothetical protein
MRKALALLSAPLAFLALVGRAAADDDLCPKGQVVNADTAGHCCWPGQAWDTAQSMCSGKPTCPEGMRRDGLTCVAGGAPDGGAAQDGGEPAASPVDGGIVHNPLPVAPPPQSSAPPTTGSTASRSVGGIMIAGGFIGVGVGYLIALGGGIWGSVLSATQHGDSGTSCADSAPYSFIPLFGPIITAAKYPKHDLYGSSSNGTTYVYDCNGSRPIVTGLVVASEIFQLGGLAMLGVGVPLLVIPGPPPKATGSTTPLNIAVLPGASGADTGGVTVRFSGF